MLAMRLALKKRTDWPKALMKPVRDAKYKQVAVKMYNGVASQFYLPAWIHPAATGNTICETQT
jgi:hypothetical protein